MTKIKTQQDTKNKEINPPKVEIFLGQDVRRLLDLDPQTREEVLSHHSSHRKLNGNGGPSSKLKQSEISDEKCDIVSILAHGNGLIIGSKDIPKVKHATKSLFESTKGNTVENLSFIQSKKHNSHFDIIGCFQGAVVQDIERQADLFQVGTTFTIQAPAQYSTQATHTNPILRDQLREYEAGNQDQAALFAKYTKQTAETTYFVKVVAGKDGKNKIIAFKAIAPKHAKDAANLEEFMTREAIYEFGKKEHQHANLITLTGQDHEEYEALHAHIAEVRANTPIKETYLHDALTLSDSRSRERKNEKLELNSRSKEKEDLGFELLKLYEKDIPEHVAKSYLGVSIKTGEMISYLNLPKTYLAGITEYALAQNKTIAGKQPVIWALEHGLRIGFDKEHPLYWAMQNDKAIGQEPAIDFAVRTKQIIDGKSALEIAVKENKIVSGKPAIELAIELDATIGGKRAIEFAMENNAKMGEKSAIEWAIERDVTIGGKSVVEWAVQKDIKQIGDLSVIEYVLTHNTTIEGQNALDWVIDHHRSSRREKHVTTKEHIIEYIDEEGILHTEKIAKGVKLNDMLSHVCVAEGKIDDIPVLEWAQSYDRQYKNYKIFKNSPVQYAISKGHPIHGNPTINLPQIYDIKEIENAAEKGDLNKLKELLTIDPNKSHESHGFTPMELAIWANNVKAIEGLIKMGGNVNQVTKSGNTLLHKAVIGGKLEAVKALLEHGSNVDTANEDGNTALMLASYSLNNKSEIGKIAELLLDHGASPNLTNKDGYSMIENAACRSNTAVIKALLEKGKVDPNSTDKYGVSLFHEAIINNPEVAIMFLQAGADPHKAAIYGSSIGLLSEHENLVETPVAIASRFSQINVIEELAKKGVDFISPGASGETPLLIAIRQLIHAEYENKADVTFAVVKKLLELGADTNVASVGSYNQAEYPLTLLISSNYFNDKQKVVNLLLEHKANSDIVLPDGRSLLQHAIERGDRELKHKILENSVNINIQDKNAGTALLAEIAILSKSYYNMYSQDLSFVKKLVQKGADVNIANKDGVTPLQMAVEMQNHELIDLLISAKADPNMHDKHSNSPLSIALKQISKGHDATILSKLLEAGANPNISDQNGWTPLHYAVEKRDVALVAKMLEKGADPTLKAKNGTSPLEMAKDKLHFESMFGNIWQIVQKFNEAIFNEAITSNHAVASTKEVAELDTTIDHAPYEQDLSGKSEIHHD